MSTTPDRKHAEPAAALAGELRLAIARLNRRLREEAHLGDLSWPQMRVVLRLEREGPATASTLARAEGMRPQSMGETVAVLKASGLVSGAPDPADGRQTVLSLTEACHEAIRATRAAREDWLHRAISTKLAPHELKTLSAAIAMLDRLAEA